MPGTIKMKNKYTHSSCIHCIPIHRPRTLGNPFKMKETTSIEREFVIQEFKLYAITQMAISSSFQKEIEKIASAYARGEEVHLLCYCYPLPCHGEFIRHLAEMWAHEKILHTTHPRSRKG